MEFPTESGQCLAVGLVVRPLVLLWGDVPQRRVPSDAVVERLDVLEDARLRLGAGGVVLVVNQFLLQAREEALHRRVVPAVPTPAHAALDPLLAQPTPVVLARVLAPAI